MLQLPLPYSGVQPPYVLFLTGPATRWCSHILTGPAATRLSLNPLHASYMLVQPPYSHSTSSPIPLLGDPQPATHWCCHQTLTRPATRRCSRHTLLDPLHSCPSMLHDVQPPNSYWTRSRQTQLNPTLHAGAAASRHTLTRPTTRSCSRHTRGCSRLQGRW
jgi:hypothetical protein